MARKKVEHNNVTTPTPPAEKTAMTFEELIAMIDEKMETMAKLSNQITKKMSDLQKFFALPEGSIKYRACGNDNGKLTPLGDKLFDTPIEAFEFAKKHRSPFQYFTIQGLCES